MNDLLRTKEFGLMSLIQEQILLVRKFQRKKHKMEKRGIPKLLVEKYLQGMHIQLGIQELILIYHAECELVAENI